MAEEQKQISRQTRDTVIQGSEELIKAQSQKTAELLDAIRRLHDHLGEIVNAIGRDDLQTSLRHRLEELSQALQAMQTSTAQSLQELDSLIENNRRQPSWAYRVVAELGRSVMASSMTFVAWIFARPYAVTRVEMLYSFYIYGLSYLALLDELRANRVVAQALVDILMMMTTTTMMIDSYLVQLTTVWLLLSSCSLCGHDQCSRCLSSSCLV